VPTVYGADAGAVIGPGAQAAAWFGGSPDSDGHPKASREQGPESPMVAWSRRVAGTLKRERQSVTDEMQRATNLARGATPWWKERPRWKIGTRLQYCATVPLTWTAILCDAQPTVSYTALDRTKQKRADIATSAWNQAYDQGKWAKAIRRAVLISRVQKKGYLRLTYSHLDHGGRGRAELRPILGEQVYIDRNARCVDDAEIVMCEYRESYGSICARFPGLRGKLQRKYDQPRTENDGSNQSVLSPPASYTMPASAGGQTYYTPAYAASPNSPDGAAGTSGMLVREFWTRPHKTIAVDEVRFLASGEPATRPKLYDTIDERDTEPLRRVTTEGGVIYELPASLVSAMANVEDGLRVLDDQPALEAITHEVRYPLYPEGRLVVIVDEDIEADDRMNPYGYIPLAEINANADPGGGQYGPSDVDLIADAYEQLIRMVCIVFDTANLSGNSIWRIPEDDTRSDDDITNAPAAIFREPMQTLKFGKREPAPNLPAYVGAHIKYLDEKIKDLSGLSDIMLGKMPPKMQVSTETMTQGQESSGVRFRDALADLSRCMHTLGEQFLELMARFYTSPVIVKVKNEAGIFEPVPMLGTTLTDPFEVEAKAGSRQPAGPSARLQTLLNLTQAGVPVPLATVYEMLEEIGAIPSATAAMREVEALKADPSKAWQLLGVAPPGGKPNATKKPGSKRQRKQGAAAG
jgi:hypothetical protein